MNIEWNADKYTKDFSFVHQYGNSVLELIGKEKGSSVLDLGCGNGVLTKELADRGYRSVGLDESSGLLNIARNEYPEITFIQGDAAGFSLDEQFDIVFSNAVFHWIDKEKQPDMMKCVYNALKTNGEFVFEFGGFGNNQKIHNALSAEFQKEGKDYKNPFFFPTIGEYASLLEQAGFKVVYATLFDRFTELKGDDGLKDWILMFVKKPFENIAIDKEKVISNAVKQLQSELYQNGKWYADYVRLRMKVIKK